MKFALQGSSVPAATVGVNTLNAVLVTVLALVLVTPAGLAPPAPLLLGKIALAGAMHVGVSRLFFYASLQRIGPNRCIPIVMSYPVVTAVTASLALGEALTLRIAAGLILLLTGIWLVVGAGPARYAAGEEDRPPSWRTWGYVFGGVTSLLWGLSAVLFKTASLALHPLSVSSYALWAGTGVSWAIALAMGRENHPFRLRWSAWGWLFASAVCQTVAIPLYNFAFTQTMAVRVTAIVSAQPLIVILISLAFLRESENITRRLVTGAILTVAGTIFVIS